MQNKALRDVRPQTAAVGIKETVVGSVSEKSDLGL